LIGHLDSNLIL